MDHLNLLRLKQVLPRHDMLVFPYMGCDLVHVLTCHKLRFTQPQVKCLMRQLLQGAAHMHSRGVVHRDIKPDNVLLANDGVVCIVDFGLAHKLSVSKPQFMGKGGSI